MKTEKAFEFSGRFLGEVHWGYLQPDEILGIKLGGRGEWGEETWELELLPEYMGI